MASAGEGNVIDNWAELLPELLMSIGKRIHSYEDFMAFGGVCRSWRCIAVKENFNHSASSRVQIPWLMLAEEGGGCSSEIRGFASLTKGGIIHRVELPEARGRHCKSSMGWLITTDEHGETELLHPLSRVRIPLPHPTSCKDYQDSGEMDSYMSIRVWMFDSEKFLVNRAVLSASPSVTDDYVLMVILGGRNCYAAFWKPGNDVWTLVERHPSVCLDVIYYKHQFYAIHKGLDRGVLLLCHTNSGDPQTVGHISCDATYPEDGNTYLVESPSGDLLVASRTVYDGCDHGGYWTSSFRIYKFDSTDMSKWQEISDLQGASIFVGHSAATAIPANAAAGIKPNCIYFTDDYVDGYSIMSNLIGGKDTGIYSLETQTTEPLPKVRTTVSNYCPPVWVYPSF